MPLMIPLTLQLLRELIGPIVFAIVSMVVLGILKQLIDFLELTFMLTLT